MIKLILKGGLGNQMFQYAAGYSLAKKISTDLILDLSFLKTNPPIKNFTKRNYELHFFNIENKTTTLLKNNFLDKYFSYALQFGYYKIFNNNYFYEKDFYRFNKEFFEQGPNTTIEGYYNNFRYFEEYQDDIKQIFDLDKFYNDKFEQIERDIDSCNSVSINVRRGDYLNSKHKNVFTFLDIDYYMKAVSLIKKVVNNPHFYIFSFDFDNPSEVLDYFGNKVGLTKDNLTILGKEYTGENFKSYFRLISLCKNNIISNSTFSFWGAYLNKNQSKVVISPKNWSYSGTQFESPPSWKLINNKK